MSKTLKAIQILAKIAKIISQIVFIFCIVGALFCIVGLVTTGIGLEALKLGGINVHGIVEESAGMSMGDIYSAMITGLILCVGEMVLAKFAEVYFKHELDAGTPFTLAGAKELMRLGILSICIPVGTAVLTGIIHGVFAAAMGAVGSVGSDLDISGNVTMGIMFIIMALFCRHAAELTGQVEPVEE